MLEKLSKFKIQKYSTEKTGSGRGERSLAGRTEGRKERPPEEMELERRMKKIREILKHRNDEEAINEYIKRYFERKAEL